MSPTLADHWLVKSADGGDNSTLTKSSYAVSDGDIIAIGGTTWDTNHGMATPTCSGQTVHTAETAAPGGFNGWVGAWWIKVSGNPGTITISMAPADATSTRHTMFGQKWTGADVDATPAVNATVSGTGTTVTVTLTTAHDNSSIAYFYVDEQSRDPASTTYQSGATQVDVNDGHVGSNSVQASAQQATTTAGSQTIGIANTSTLALCIVGFEIKPAAANLTGDATSTITASSTATGANTAVGAATSTETVGGTAVGVNAAVGAAASAITAGQSAAGQNAAAGGATQAVTAGGAAAGANAAVGSAASAVTASSTASAVAGSVAAQAITAGDVAVAEVIGRQRGSWYQLLDIRRHARQEFGFYANQPPTACPNDGEPLIPGPASEPGILFCPYDGWQYPRDWVRPESPAGLFDGAADAPGGSYAGAP